MAAINFPDPNVQTSYTNPDTGITYEWASGKWKSASSTQLGELFVDEAGDNLTGNLTLGTDKIVLDATIGSATFTNNVDVKRSTANSDLKLSGSDTHAVWVSNGNFALKYDGTATFAGGDLTINNSGNLLSQRSGSTGFVDLNSTGILKVRGAASGSVFVIENSSTGSTTASVLGNGSATFAGSVGIGTTSPSESLEVAGNGLKVSGQTSSVTDEGLTFDWDSGNNNGRIFSESAGSSNLLFYTTSSGTRAEAMRIDSSGRVLIGTDASGFADAAHNLTIADDGNCGMTIRAGTSSSVSSIYFADGTTGGANYAGFIDYQHNGDHMRFGTNGGQERMRIDSSGNLLVGGSSSSNLIRLGQKFAVSTTSSYGGGSFTGFNGTTAAEGPIIDIQRSRGTTTVGTAVAANDRLGSFVFRGDNGTDFVDAAYMLGEVDGTPSGGFVPGRFTFYTGTGSAAPTERMRIDSSGTVQISMGGSGYATLFRYGSNEDNFIRSGVNGVTAFGDHNGVEAMRILPTGGLTFNGDTTQANALDDYEEGTWTPTIRENGSGAAWNTLSAQEGFYTKIGNCVTFSATFNYSEVATNVNTIYYSWLAGFPYASSSSKKSGQFFISFLYAGVRNVVYSGNFIAGNAYAGIFKDQDSTTPGPMMRAEFPTGAHIVQFQGHYYV